MPLFAPALGIETVSFGPAAARTAHARNELALTRLLLRRTAEADVRIAETWGAMAPPHAIVAPGTAFLQGIRI